MKEKESMFRRIFFLSNQKYLQNVQPGFRKAILAVYWLALLLIAAVIVDSLLPDFGRQQEFMVVNLDLAAAHEQVYDSIVDSTSYEETRNRIKNRLAIEKESQAYKGEQAIIDSLAEELAKAKSQLATAREQIEDFQVKHSWGYGQFAQEIDRLQEKAKKLQTKTQTGRRQSAENGEDDPYPVYAGMADAEPEALAANVLPVDLPEHPVSWLNLIATVPAQRVIHGVTVPVESQVECIVSYDETGELLVVPEVLVLPDETRIPISDGYISADAQGKDALEVWYKEGQSGGGAIETVGKGVSAFRKVTGSNPVTDALSGNVRTSRRATPIGTDYIGPGRAYAVINKLEKP